MQHPLPESEDCCHSWVIHAVRNEWRGRVSGSWTLSRLRPAFMTHFLSGSKLLGVTLFERLGLRSRMEEGRKRIRGGREGE